MAEEHGIGVEYSERDCFRNGEMSTCFRYLLEGWLSNFRTIFGLLDKVNAGADQICKNVMAFDPEVSNAPIESDAGETGSVAVLRIDRMSSRRMCRTRSALSLFFVSLPH